MATDRGLDSVFALRREGYTFVGRRVRRHGAEAFRARLVGRRVVYCLGADAVEMFSVPGRMTRRGAQPLASRLLQDGGAVQLLDGDAHVARKALLLSLLDGQRLSLLVDAFEAQWRRWLDDSPGTGEVVLLHQARALLCAAACEWAGVELAPRDVRRRADQLAAIIEGTGSIGPRLVRGLVARRSAAAWARRQVEGARRAHLRPLGERVPPGCSPLVALATHRDGTELLPVEVAAAELLNLLRPVVAVAHFVVFAALALHEHPEWAERLRRRPDEHLGPFVREVRRFYPFFPLVGGRARAPFDWHGRRVPVGTWFLLDLYGTNHDPDLWGDPDVFRPSRFPGAGEVPHLVPQGAGDVRTGHRCAGEHATTALVERAVLLLTGAMRYQVPPQDLAVRLSRLPALPASGVVLADVAPAPPTGRCARP